MKRRRKWPGKWASIRSSLRKSLWNRSKLLIIIVSWSWRSRKKRCLGISIKGVFRITSFRTGLLESICLILRWYQTSSCRATKRNIRMKDWCFWMFITNFTTWSWILLRLWMKRFRVTGWVICLTRNMRMERQYWNCHLIGRSGKRC